MASELIQDRGRGPEIAGTRITVYSLLEYFLDPSVTEDYICQLHELKPEEVAAARAYVLNNPDEVLGKHLQIEAKMAAGNPPELVERAKETHSTFLRFKEWLARRKESEARERAAEATSPGGHIGSRGVPAFEEWLAERESPSTQGG